MYPPRLSWIRTAVGLLGLSLGLTGPVARSAEKVVLGPHLVFMIGEDVYRTGETLPAFIKQELAPLGFRTTIVTADPMDPNHFPGIEAIRDADLLVLSVRRTT